MKRKIMIIAVTILLTLGAVVYVTLAKPIYSGSTMMEVGEVVNYNNTNNTEQVQVISLDNINNLKNITSKVTGVSVTVPKGTNRILELSYVNESKEVIKSKLKSATDYIINRHKEKAKLYEGENAKIRSSKLVGEITVSDKAVKPKKTLVVVVAFITGLILSIFLAFFMEFIQGAKREEQ